jgi:hypothetical protein
VLKDGRLAGEIGNVTGASPGDVMALAV